MKKIIFLIFVITALCTSNVMASEVNDSTEIPEVKLEVLLQIMQSKKAKIDILFLQQNRSSGMISLRLFQHSVGVAL